MEERALLGYCQRGNSARHVLGAERRAFQRIYGDIDFGARFGADLLADEQHRRLIHLALADDDGAVDQEAAQFAPHGVHGRLIGFLLRAAAAEAGGGDSRTFSHAHDFE